MQFTRRNRRDSPRQVFDVTTRYLLLNGKNQSTNQLQKKEIYIKAMCDKQIHVYKHTSMYTYTYTPILFRVFTLLRALGPPVPHSLADIHCIFTPAGQGNVNPTDRSATSGRSIFYHLTIVEDHSPMILFIAWQMTRSRAYRL